MKIPLDMVISRIQEKTGLSPQEIDMKIQQKLDALAGLISKEGAGHIVANELGVNLYENLGGKMSIKQIVPGMNGVAVAGKVTRIFDLREFNKGDRSGKVQNLVIGDETGTIRLVLWNDHVDKIQGVKEGDVIQVEGVYSKENQGRAELHAGDKAAIERNPSGVEIGEIAQASRKKISELMGGESDIEILGTVVQLFDPRYFEVCPECGKRAREFQDQYACETHGAVTPAYSYVVNAVIDDGSEPNGSIRVTCFRQQADRLCGKELLEYKENPIGFNELKQKMLGSVVKIVGRVNKNQMYDRIEFMAQRVFSDVDPAQEMQRVGQKTIENPQAAPTTQEATPVETSSALEQPATPEPVAENTPKPPEEDIIIEEEMV